MHTVKAMDEHNEQPSKETDFEGEINCEDLTQTEQRSLVFHLLYAVDAYEYDVTLESIVESFAVGFQVIIPKESAVYQKTASIIAQRATLDALIVPLIDNWRFERLGVSTKLILRQSLWEFLHTQTDHAVIINEAVELAKCFAEKDAFKFINGILDEYVKRSAEPQPLVDTE